MGSAFPQKSNPSGIEAQAVTRGNRAANGRDVPQAPSYGTASAAGPGERYSFFSR